MKKFSKAFAAIASLALLAGSAFVSCSSGGGGGGDDFTSQTTEITNDATTLGVATTVVTSADTSIATVDYKDENKSAIVITSKTAGSTTVTAKEDADKDDYARITVTVAEDGEITASVTKKIGEEEGGEEETGDEFELSTLWKFSDYAETLGATTTSTAVGEAKTCGIVVMGKNVKIRSDGDGISGTITEGVTGYCQLSNGKDGALLLTVPAGTEKIVLGAKNVNGLKIVASDGSTVLKEFAAVEGSNYANYEYEYSFTEETQVYIGPFETSKTCNFKAIGLYKKAVVLDPPTAANFTANSTAEGYSITIDSTKETVTGLEYSTDNKETWNDVSSATVTLTTYGTVYFRYKATAEAGASKAISVSVTEYVDTSKPQAEKPAATNFTVNKIVNGEGSVVLTSIEGIEYLNASDAWEDAVAKYTVTTASTLKFRTKETTEKRASEALEVAVAEYELLVSAVTTWDLTSHANAMLWNTIPERTTSANVAAIITTAANSYVGYLGKGLYVTSGTAFEYVGSERGLGYTKWAADSSTDEEKTANIGKIVPAVQTGAAVEGPFKVTVTPKTSNTARKLAFYVSSSADTLFTGDPVYTSAALAATDISYTYTGTDEVFVGFGTISTDGKVYTEITKIVVTAAETIPADEFAATAVAFVDSEKATITSLTLSKAQAVAGYQLATTLTPAYSTDEVTYAIKEEDAKGISLTNGKVTVAETYTGNNTVTVVATAREGVTAELSLSVNAEIALETTSVVTVALATGSSASIYTTGKTTLTATLDKDYTNVASYEWYVGNTKQSATTSTFEFSNESAGTYEITAKAVSSASPAVTTAESAVFEVKVIEPPITVASGVATLNADSYEYYLSFGNLSDTTGDNAWTATSATKGKESSGKASTNSGTTMFKTAIQPVDLKTNMTETLKVTGVAQIDIYIFDSNRKRAFKITIKEGDADAVTTQYYTYGEYGEAIEAFTKSGSDKASTAATSWDPDDNDKGATAKQFCYSIKLDSTKECTITLEGGQKSVYPLGVVLKKTADSE